MHANQVIAANRVVEVLNTMLDKPKFKCDFSPSGVWITLTYEDEQHTHSESEQFDGNENSSILWLKCRTLVNAFCSKFDELQHAKRFGIAV